MDDRRKRVVWTATARVALDDAIEYIMADSPDAARRLAERLLSAASSLTTLANRGRPVAEIADPSVRELLVSPYRLLYRTQDAEVLVLALVHEARDFDRWRAQAPRGL